MESNAARMWNLPLKARKQWIFFFFEETNEKEKEEKGAAYRLL